MSQNPSPHPALATSRFLAFFDECGDHSLLKIDPDFPLFVLALVVVERTAYAEEILLPFNRFKLRYFNHEGVNLHSRDIRVSSGPFLLLRNPVIRPVFVEELSGLVERSPFTLFISAIRKQAYLERHGSEAASPYDLALRFTMESLAQFMAAEGENRLPIAAEARGKVEDAALEQVFGQILIGGTAHWPAEKFKGLDFKLSFQPKFKNIIGTQVADLCAYPCARHILSPQSQNRAFAVVRPKLYQGKDCTGWNVYP
jgi:hypothetical protein